jgi:SpoVK/Ycf46/Vps4 family AAA+-type ATPase
MDFKTFQKGIAILSACISDFKATNEGEKLAVWYEMTKDLSDRVYLEAIKRICRETTNIYPGTNIVGLIRDAAEQTLREMSEKPTKRLQLESGYTDEQFESGRERLKLILTKLNKKIGG